MYISKVKIVTKESVDKLKEYRKGNYLKYDDINYKYVNVYKILADDKDCFKGIVFSCSCSNLFTMSTSKLSYNFTYSEIESINCGCVQIKKEENIISEAKRTYYKKENKSSNNPYWCTYCESYRPEVKQKSKNTYHCNNCEFLIKKAVVLGETFEEIMARWDSSTHKPCTKKLPYLEGNNKKGYKVKGFTYISTDWYEEASKWLWTKSQYYVKTSFSKENLNRINKGNLYKSLKDRKHKAVMLHRFVLGLGNDVDRVGDHINGYKLDNRGTNLRYITNYQNSLNSKKSSKRLGSSKYKGISFYKDRFDNDNRCWKATLSISGKHKVKYFYKEVEAAKYYDSMLRKYLPDEINRYNFPRDGEMSAI